MMKFRKRGKEGIPNHSQKKKRGNLRFSVGKVTARKNGERQKKKTKSPEHAKPLTEATKGERRCSDLLPNSLARDYSRGNTLGTGRGGETTLKNVLVGPYLSVGACLGWQPDSGSASIPGKGKTRKYIVAREKLI